MSIEEQDRSPYAAMLACLTQRPETQVVWVLPGSALIEREGGLILLCRGGPWLERLLSREAAQKLLKQGGSLEILQIGGDRALLEALAAAIQEGYFQAWHQPEDGPLWQAPRRGGVYEGPLYRHLQLPAGEPDWEALRVLLTQRREQLREIQGYAQSVGRRRPWLAPLLCGWLAIVWVLSLWVGAPDWTPAMIRMGAMAPLLPSVETEFWRMLAYANLHADWMHIGFNSLVLYRMGSSVERLIGPARLLILYVLAALGGGIAVQLWGHGVTVGASGAIWGLLGAEASLVLGRQGVLPDRIAAQARSGVLQNLFLNGLISFHPQVSWAGHLGGGIAGFLLLQSGFLTAGLPRWNRPGPPRSPACPPPSCRCSSHAPSPCPAPASSPGTPTPPGNSSSPCSTSAAPSPPRISTSRCPAASPSSHLPPQTPSRPAIPSSMPSRWRSASCRRRSRPIALM